MDFHLSIPDIHNFVTDLHLLKSRFCCQHVFGSNNCEFETVWKRKRNKHYELDHCLTLHFASRNVLINKLHAYFQLQKKKIAVKSMLLCEQKKTRRKEISPSVTTPLNTIKQVIFYIMIWISLKFSLQIFTVIIENDSAHLRHWWFTKFNKDYTIFDCVSCVPFITFFFFFFLLVYVSCRCCSHCCCYC